MSPHKHELGRIDEEDEGFPITSISVFHEFEELDSLATHADDTQFPYLQIMGIWSNLEQQDFQRLSYLQLEYQRHSSSYEYVISNYDKEGDVEISESLLSTRTLSNSIFQKTDDKKCVYVVIDACYQSIFQKSKEDLFSFDISYKDIIVEEEIVSCDKPTYHHGEIKL